MTPILIAYDLAEPAIAAGPLAQAIMQLGHRWARPLASLWFVETTASPAEIEALLAPLLAADDGLLVQRTAEDATMVNTVARWSQQRQPAAIPAARERGWSSPASGAIVHLPISSAGVAVAA